AHPDPRRGDVRPRHRVGGPRAGSPRAPDGAPDHPGRRAPPLHRAPRRSHRRRVARADRREWNARRAAGTRTGIPEALRAAVRRGGGGRSGGGGRGRTPAAPHDAAARAAARDAAGAWDSPFRRHWTWRDRLVVGVVGWLIATALRLVYLTLRVRWIDPHDVVGAHARGQRVVWATWHDGIVLLPLMVVRVCPTLRPRVALSWHRDGEIAAQAVRRFGVAVTRGSAARGWVGAMRGLLAANARGE